MLPCVKQSGPIVAACWLCLSLGTCLPVWAQTVQLSPSKISPIQPGTVIDSEAPQGWTYLLFKNSSRIGAGDLQAATDQIQHLASFLSSAMVANVAPVSLPGGTESFVLKEIGYGLLARVGNVDKVVSSDSHKQVGANFGLIDSMALSAVEKRIDRLQVTAKTATMGIVDSPTMVRLGGTHQEVTVRHAILVEPQSGSAVTLVWFFQPPRNKQPGQIVSDIDFLTPNSVLSVTLHLDKREFSLGLITERALALNQMMWGKVQIKVQPNLLTCAATPTFSKSQIEQLEAELRSMIQPSK